MVAIAFAAAAPGILGTSTLALAATGVAVAAASVVDRLYIYPALFGSDEQRPDSLNDVQIATFDVGAPRNWAFGRGVVVPGHLMWMTDPVITASGGGRKASKAGVTQNSVSASFAVAWNDRITQELHRIWMNAKQWYSAGTFTNKIAEHRIEATIDGSNVKLTAQTEAIDFSLAFAPDQVLLFDRWSNTVLNDWWNVVSVTAVSASGGSEMVIEPINGQAAAAGNAGTSTHPATMEHKTVAANDGTWSWLTSRSSSIVYLRNITDEIAELFRVGDEIFIYNDATIGGLWEYRGRHVIEQNTMEFQTLEGHSLTPFSIGPLATTNPRAFIELRKRNYQFSPASSVPDDWRTYRGYAEQLADDDIVTEEGADNVPAYRGRCYSRFTDVNLNSWGNQLGQPKALITRHVDDRVYIPLEAILQRSGFGAGQYTIHGAWDFPLNGYNVRGIGTGIANLQPLMVHYDIIFQERGAVMAFFPRTQAHTVTVRQEVTATNRTLRDVGAHINAEGPSDPVVVVDADVPIPTRVEITFIDILNNYQTGTEGYGQRNTNGPDDEQHIERIDYGSLSLYRWEVKNRATELLYQAKLNAKQVGTTLPSSYMYLLENDRVELTDPTTGEGYSILAQRVRRDANMLIHVEGFVDSTDKVDGSTAQGGNPLNPWSGGGPAQLIPHVLDVTALRVADLWTPGVYVCAGTSSPWGGATVWESLDGSSYYQIATLSLEANVGTATDTLASGPINNWDLVNSVNVTLNGKSVTSIAQMSVLGWRNIALIGDEVVGFADVVQESDGTFTLSTLLRGMRNTEYAIDTHDDGDRFVLLFDHVGNPTTSDGLIFREHDRGSSAIGQTRYYKFVPAGLGLNDVDAEEIVIAGWNARPFSPTNLVKTLDISNNASYSWDRRTRNYGATFGTAPMALLEEREEYDMEVLDGSANVVHVFQLRSRDSGRRDATPRSLTYTATLQTAHGFTPGDPIRVKLYQVGAAGRSRPLDLTL